MDCVLAKFVIPLGMGKVGKWWCILAVRHQKGLGQGMRMVIDFNLVQGVMIEDKQKDSCRRSGG